MIAPVGAGRGNREKNIIQALTNAFYCFDVMNHYCV